MNRIININKIITETLHCYLQNNILFEAKSYNEVLKLLSMKYNGKVDPHTIQSIMDIDTTKKFSYTQWAIKAYTNGNNNVYSNNNDLLRTLKILFNYAKTHDDYQLQTYKTISDAIDGLDMHNGKYNYDVIYDDEDWTIYIPLTYEANRYIVWNIYGGSRWCTASDLDGEYNGKEKFDFYTKNGGRLFIFVRKKDGELFQLSDNEKEIRDRDNWEIDFDYMELSNKVINFFQTHFPDVDIVKTLKDNEGIY